MKISKTLKITSLALAAVIGIGSYGYVTYAHAQSMSQLGSTEPTSQVENNKETNDDKQPVDNQQDGETNDDGSAQTK